MKIFNIECGYKKYYRNLYKNMKEISIIYNYQENAHNRNVFILSNNDIIICLDIQYEKHVIINGVRYNTGKDIHLFTDLFKTIMVRDSYKHNPSHMESILKGWYNL